MLIPAHTMLVVLTMWGRLLVSVILVTMEMDTFAQVTGSIIKSLFLMKNKKGISRVINEEHYSVAL